MHSFFRWVKIKLKNTNRLFLLKSLKIFPTVDDVIMTSYELPTWPNAHSLNTTLRR